MFQGSYVALITPFDGGRIAERAFGDFVEWQISEGTHGLLSCGTTGESPTLSHPEHQRVTEICVEVADGRVPVLAGTGSNSTEEAISLTRHAKACGADAALVVTPYYNKPTQEGLYQHFKAINDAVDIPVLIYNIPGTLGRGHVGGDDGTVREAFEHRRGEGRFEQLDPPPRDPHRLRRRLRAALRGGRGGARAARRGRPRLHLGHRERRAAPLLADAHKLDGR